MIEINRKTERGAFKRPLTLAAEFAAFLLFVVAGLVGLTFLEIVTSPEIYDVGFFHLKR